MLGPVGCEGVREDSVVEVLRGPLAMSFVLKAVTTVGFKRAQALYFGLLQRWCAPGVSPLRPNVIWTSSTNASA